MSKRPERTGVMLAFPTTEKSLAKLPNVVIAQPKLNGERCKVIWFENEPYFISSYGNEFKFMERIRQELLSIYKETGIKPPFDGEVYKHGWPRERIHSAISRKKNYNPDIEELEFHIFDVCELQMQEERLNTLHSVYRHKYESDSIKFVEARYIVKDSWEVHTIEYIESGYEGIILRHPNAFYQEKRTKDMLKFKPTEFDVYDIVDYKEGTGWTEGMLGSFGVRGEDSTVFYVGTGPELTKEKRILYWKERDKLIGRKLKVKHEPIKTVGGIPVCTVAMEVI